MISTGVTHPLLDHLQPVSIHGAFLLPDKDTLDRQHGDHSEDLVTAPQLHRGDQHLGQDRVEGEVCHGPPQGGDHLLVVKGVQSHESGQSCLYKSRVIMWRPGRDLR